MLKPFVFQVVNQISIQEKRQKIKKIAAVKMKKEMTENSRNEKKGPA